MKSKSTVESQLDVNNYLQRYNMKWREIYSSRLSNRQYQSISIQHATGHKNWGSSAIAPVRIQKDNVYQMLKIWTTIYGVWYDINDRSFKALSLGAIFQ